MLTVEISEAKEHLEDLIQAAGIGGAFMISREGEPVAKVEAMFRPAVPKQDRTPGTLAHLGWTIPDDFDRFAEDEIANMFGIEP